MHPKVLNLIARAYEFVFKESPPESVLRFAKNFSWMSFGTFGSTLVTAVFTLLLVRLLGPFEYGQATLVIRISSFMLLPILWNLHNAIARYLPHAATDEERKQIISTSFLILCASLVLFGVVFFFLGIVAAPALKIDTAVWEYGLWYTAVVALYLFFSGALRGLGDFKRQSVIYFASSFVLVAVALFFILFFERLEFQAFAIPLIARWLFVAVLFYFFLKKFLSFSFHKAVAKEIFIFSFYTLLGSSAIVFMQSIDSLMLNYFYSAATVGVFGAYLLASTIVSGKLLDTVAGVALPTVSAIDDPRPLFGKLMRLWKKSFIPIFALSVLTTLVGFLFFGGEYPFSWPLALLFSAQAMIYSIASIHFWLITSRGREAAQFSAVHLLTSAVLNIVLNYALIPRLEIAGAVLATIIASGYLIVASARYFKKYSPAGKEDVLIPS